MLDDELSQIPATPRPLTAEESALTQWLLENAQFQPVEKYLEQLTRARVNNMCPCGCPSFDLEIEGIPQQTGGIGIIGDFQFGEGDEYGNIFVFEQNGILAGVEVVWYSDVPPLKLPTIASLRHF